MSNTDWSFWVPVSVVVAVGIGILAALIFEASSINNSSKIKNKQFMQCVELNGTFIEGRHMNFCVTGIIPMEDK